MTKQKFNHNETYLPVNPDQWETLVNEMLEAFNRVAAPKFIDGDTMAQMLAYALHGGERGKGIVSKQALFESCIHIASMHISNSISKAIDTKRAENAKATADATEGLPPNEPGPASDALSIPSQDEDEQAS